ncbi:MAG: acyl carrier protein [Clostridia bacterium]|nr:acyl carrier protein [Clostridia bacterium]
MTIEKVRETVAEQLGMDINEISADTTFEDLGIDSLDTVELMMELEDVFGIEIDAEKAGNSVSSLSSYIDSIKG